MMCSSLQTWFKTDNQLNIQLIGRLFQFQTELEQYVKNGIENQEKTEAIIDLIECLIEEVD